MPSQFVFEEGEAIDVGSHGEHDFTFHEGEPVPDTGQSTLTFEEGTGLGSAGHLIFAQGDMSNRDWTTWKSNLEAVGYQVDIKRSTNESFDSAIQGGYASVSIMCESRPSSSEKSAFADFWDSNGRAMVMGEDDGAGGSGRRAGANDYIEAATGVRPLNADEDTRRDAGCYSNLTPTGEHVVFDGIDSVWRHNNEALMTQDAPPAYAVWSDSTNIWGYIDNTEGRLWVDGGYVSADDSGRGCGDNHEYHVRAVQWINGDL